MSHVCVLMSVYNPNMEWLQQELQSINRQNYPDMELLICDDCSTDVEYKYICSVIQTEITRYRFAIYRNEQNLGSNATFEKLASMAHGEYVVFCDQDDIWQQNRISRLVETIEKSGSDLVYAKASVIDSSGNMLYDDWNSYRKYYSIPTKPDDMIKALLFENWIAGCFMLVKTGTVQRALSFSPYTIYDQWVALAAAVNGGITYLDESLLRYRRHTKTQTGSFAGIDGKKAYYQKRIVMNLLQAEYLLNRYKNSADIFVNAYFWAEARQVWWNNAKIDALRKMLKNRSINSRITWFECVAARLPEPVFVWILRLIKK